MQQPFACKARRPCRVMMPIKICMQQPFACKARRPCRMAIAIMICMQQPFACKARRPLHAVVDLPKSRKLRLIVGQQTSVKQIFE